MINFPRRKRKFIGKTPYQKFLLKANQLILRKQKTRIDLTAGKFKSWGLFHENSKNFFFTYENHVENWAPCVKCLYKLTNRKIFYQKNYYYQVHHWIFIYFWNFPKFPPLSLWLSVFANRCQFSGKLIQNPRVGIVFVNN